MSATFVLGLGTNLGSRWGLLRAALARVGAIEGVRVEAIGRPRRTAALVLPEASPGPPFLNGVARLRTTLEPQVLLAALHRVEAELGRQRDRRWAARTMDLDLLTWSGPPVAAPDLSIPHAELSKRPFARAGVADLGGPAAEDPAAPFADPPRLRVRGALRTVTAADDADALAWALTLGEAAGPFEALEAPSTGAFVEAVNRRAAGAVVVFEHAASVRGATAPIDGQRASRRSLTALEGGHCRIRLVE